MRTLCLLTIATSLALGLLFTVGCDTPPARGDQVAAAAKKVQPRFTIKYLTVEGNIRSVDVQSCTVVDGFVSYTDPESGYTMIVGAGSRVEVIRRW